MDTKPMDQSPAQVSSALHYQVMGPQMQFCTWQHNSVFFGAIQSEVIGCALDVKPEHHIGLGPERPKLKFPLSPESLWVTSVSHPLLPWEAYCEVKTEGTENYMDALNFL